MGTDGSSVLARMRSFFRSSSTVTWWLGAVLSVTVLFGIDNYVSVPESVLWLLAAGVGPAVYYRLHYESIEVESSFGRRTFRVSLLLVVWAVTSTPSLEPVPAALRFLGLLALFDAISTAARVNVVDPPAAAGVLHYFVVFAALGSLAYAVWYSAGLSVVESPRSSDAGTASASRREEGTRRDPPWQRSGWSDRGGS